MPHHPIGRGNRFIVETARRRPQGNPRVIAIEVKQAEQYDRRWEAPMRSLGADENITVDRMIGVYCGTRMYRYESVEVFPFFDFIQALHAGEIF